MPLLDFLKKCFGTDLIGNGLEDVIAYLKDKKNQDIYLSIMSEIKSK